MHILACILILALLAINTPRAQRPHILRFVLTASAAPQEPAALPQAPVTPHQKQH